MVLYQYMNGSMRYTTEPVLKKKETAPQGRFHMRLVAIHTFDED
ncbi:hypothetical protein SAMN05518855_10011065 [Paenibacillus sp. CF384]|nr:hypothetical protein SAMN05518855_10011065 [Paenibacillus sp. CF384]